MTNGPFKRTSGIRRNNPNNNGNTHNKPTDNKIKNNSSVQNNKTTRSKPSFGDPYVLFKKDKNPRKFPFVTPKQALNMNNVAGVKKPFKLNGNPDDLKIIAFGGLEQVGINCMGFEYKNEILIVDLGLQFPDQYSHGINFRVPDLSYLKGKKVVGIAITHGHIDHIGAIPHLIKYFDKSTPIYGTPMAFELIKLKQKQYKYSPNLKSYNKGIGVNIGKYFSVTPFVVDHSIPDSIGLFINTPKGNIVHTGDWKFDNTPPSFRPSVNYSTLESFGKIGVKLLLSDSTNAYEKGHSMSEKEVEEPLEKIFEKANGRIITATFSSIIDRIALIIQTSEKCGRKVVLLGKGMNDYMTIAKKLGYVRHKKNTIISMREAEKLPDSKLTICCTGAQGERYAALMRIAIGESRDTKLKKTDTVVFSSSVIPGNERPVAELYGIIMESGAKTFTYRENNIHAGGHAREDDIKHMIDLIKPEYFMPIYGERHMLHKNGMIAESVGYNQKNIIIARNGEVISIGDKSIKAGEFISHKYVTVDGGFVGLTGEKEIHERMQLRDSGAIFISVTWQKNKFFYAVSSTGFPPLEDKLVDLKNKIFATLDRNILAHKEKIFENINTYREELAKKVGNLIFHETEKEPIIVIHIVK